MKTSLIWSVAVQLTMLGLANAQPKAPWVGRRVFTQFGSVSKVEDDVVDDEGKIASLTAPGKGRKTGRIHRGEQNTVEWLRLRDEKSGISRWVQSKYVIPYEQAIDYFTNQIRSNPQAYLYNSRGLVWQEKGEYDIAIADFNEAMRLEPGEAVYLSNRGIAWDGKKDYEKAISDFDEAIRLNPRLPLAYYNRGNAWKAKKEYDKAIADFNEVVRLDPKFAFAHNNLAWIWATCPDGEYRDAKKAVESATKSCELSDWKAANILGTLAAAYAESGDFDKAMEWQEKAHKFYSDDDKKKWRKLLDLYRAKKPYRDE